MKSHKGLVLIISMLAFFFLASLFAIAEERIVDNAGLLSAAEKAELTRMADSIAAAYNFDLVIVTERNIDASAADYADDFFNNMFYGRDGSLFIHVTELREYNFRDFGRGRRLLTSLALDKLEADALRFLRQENNYEAYKSFLLNCETFLEMEAKGRSYNFFHQWNIVLVSISWLIALAVGFIVVRVWKAGMNTALLKTQAAGYVVPGSLNFNMQKDSFLYSNVVKTKRQTQSSSGGGTSSGGRGGRY